MNLDFTRAFVGGILGTIAMTVVGVYGAPMMGIDPMNPAVMLAGAMGGNMLLGWVGHFMIGAALAVIYGAVAVSALPGPAFAKGAIYSLAPWLLAQLAVMPMMGMPVFSGSAMMAMGSLIGHLAYGAVLGVVYGEAEEVAPVAA
jgi:uncharacterized membrane protein YagU involved in acid resistance